MLDLLYMFRKGSSEPAANLRETQRWINTLPLQDEYEAHHMIVGALNLFNTSTELLNMERFKVLMRLDESSRAMQQGLCNQYLKNQGVLKNAEKVLWKEIYVLYWQLAHGYLAFIKEVIAAQGEHQLNPFLPQMTARAIHYFGMEIKWRYFRQQSVEPAMWRRLHKLYRISETGRFSSDQLALDNGSMATTCEAQYASVLLLDLLHPASFKPAQIEVITQWLGDWAGLVAIGTDADHEHDTHHVDLAGEAGAARLAAVQSSNPKIRYWSIKKILDQVDSIRDKLHTGSLPEKFNLPAGYGLAECLDLLDQVYTLWSRTTASRQASRDSERKRVEVVCGIEAVQLRLKDDLGDETDFGAKSAPAQHWVMENEASGGFGLSIEPLEREKNVVGLLVGVRKSPEDGRWEIGATRWVRENGSGRLAVGVEKLGNSPRLIRLNRVDEKPQLVGDQLLQGQQKTGEDGFEAIFLPMVDERGMASSLIMPDSEYASVRMLDLHENDFAYRVRLTTVLEQNDDWVRVKFDVLGRRRAAG
jgi:hypothetical protein